MSNRREPSANLYVYWVTLHQGIFLEMVGVSFLATRHIVVGKPNGLAHPKTFYFFSTFFSLLLSRKYGDETHPPIRDTCAHDVHLSFKKKKNLVDGCACEARPICCRTSTPFFSFFMHNFSKKNKMLNNAKIPIPEGFNAPLDLCSVHSYTEHKKASQPSSVGIEYRTHLWVGDCRYNKKRHDFPSFSNRTHTLRLGKTTYT